MVKKLPELQETQVQSLDRENLGEKEMATHSSILAWRIPWTGGPDGLQSIGLQESDTTEQLTHTHTHTHTHIPSPKSRIHIVFKCTWTVLPNGSHARTQN